MSAHFTLAEVVKSTTAARLGINNELPTDYVQYWNAGLDTLEAIRTFNGDKPILITSGFRCAELNKHVKGSSINSQHVGKSKGFYCCAFDIECPATGNAALFFAIREQMRQKKIDVDQLIWEYGNNFKPAWVHIGMVFGKKMRGQILRKRVGSTKYESFA